MKEEGFRCQMNYLNRIAFLGKKRLQNYEGTDWLPLNSDGVWTSNLPEDMHADFLGKSKNIQFISWGEHFKNFYGFWADGRMQKFTDSFNISPSLQYPAFYDPYSQTVLFIERRLIPNKDKILDFVEKEGSSIDERGRVQMPDELLK